MHLYSYVHYNYNYNYIHIGIVEYICMTHIKRMRSCMYVCTYITCGPTCIHGYNNNIYIATQFISKIHEFMIMKPSILTYTYVCIIVYNSLYVHTYIRTYIIKCVHCTVIVIGYSYVLHY